MRLRFFFILLLFYCFCGKFSSAQRVHAYNMDAIVTNGDTMPLIRFRPISIFDKPVLNSRRDQRRYDRLVRAFKLTYPIALDAKARMYRMEDHLLSLKTKPERDAYIKSVEKELKRIYTPILRRMSLYQGIVLMKLIDRETGNTSYELVKEFRGRFSAFFWQGIARLFGANLKTQYDAYGDDIALEQLVYLYEEGFL